MTDDRAPVDGACNFDEAITDPDGGEDDGSGVGGGVSAGILEMEQADKGGQLVDELDDTQAGLVQGTDRAGGDGGVAEDRGDATADEAAGDVVPGRLVVEVAGHGLAAAE